MGQGLFSDRGGVTQGEAHFDSWGRNISCGPKDEYTSLE